MNSPSSKKFHPDFIKQVREQVDIVEVVSGYVSLKRVGKEFLGCCPFHDEASPSFSVTASKGLAYCFGCGWGGNAIKFLMEVNRAKFVDAVLELARSANIPVKFEDGSTEYNYPDPLPRLLTPLAPVAKEEAAPAKDYTVNQWRVNQSIERLLSGSSDAVKALAWLEHRGIDREMVKRYRLGLEKRVVAPDHSKPDCKEEYPAIGIFILAPNRPGRFYIKKRVCPWLTNNERPNYLGKWAQFGVPTTIWFAYNPPDATETWLCEGEWDSLMLGELARQRGEKVAVACSTSGASTVPKPEELEKLPGPVTIFYDRDEAGEKGARKLAAALGDRGWIGSVPMPSNCQVEGWDISNAIQAGYTWEDFESADVIEPKEKIEESKSVSFQRYIKPIEELPQVGFHVIRNSQDELLDIFDALKTKRGEEWLQLRRFTPTVTIDSRYVDYDFKPGENLALNSGFNTGKSYFINGKWLVIPDEGATFGGYRNCLNEQFCANGKKLNGRSWYQIQADLKNSQDAALISDPQSRIAGAVDSWVYFAPHHFDGKKVIFDEVESVAKHLNQSSTAVAFYREIIKERVSNALTSSTANLIADGNLRDFTVEYFEKLSGGKKFTKILNTYAVNRGKIHLYNGSSRQRKATEEDVKNGLAIEVGDWISFDRKPDDFSKLHRVMVDLPIDIPILVLADSQKKCEAWDRELSAKGRKVFRLDSTTSTSDLGKLFLTDPKSFILSERIDTVVLSPSAESGVSIELLDELKRKRPGYFKYEFAFFFGVSVTDIQTQFLGRNRDPYTNKFAYVQTHSMPSTRQITDEENSQDIFSMWAQTMKDCASLSLQGLEEGEILKIALEKIKRQLLDPHTQYESKLLLKESFEQKYPRLCLEYALREAGWEVLTVESRQDDLSDLRAMEQEIAEQKAMAVFSAEEITSTEADKLARKLNKSPEERNQIARTRLISRLPGITEKVVTVEKIVQDEQQLKQIEESESEKVTKVEDLSYPEWQNSPKEIPSGGVKITVEKPAFNPDFVNKVLYQDRAFVSRIEAQFLLRNPEICKLIQQQKWYKKLDLLTDPDSVSFGGLPMSRYRSKWLEIHTLYQMGIAFFLDPENSWHNEAPQVLSFWEQGKIPCNARKIGVKHEDDPCTYIGKVLKRFGLATKQHKQRTRPDGTRYREYSIRELDSLSQAVYDCLEQRITNQVSEFNFDWKKIVKNSDFKTVETLTNQSIQPAHLQPDNYIEARVEVCSSRDVGEPSEGATKPNPIAQLRELLLYAHSFDRFASATNGYTQEEIESAIALADTQPHRKQLSQWLADLGCCQAEATVEFCLNALEALEAPETSTIQNSEELVCFWNQIEEKASLCERELPGDFWNRVSVAMGEVSNLLVEQQELESRLSAVVASVKDAIKNGTNAVRYALSRLDITERWWALDRLSIEEQESFGSIAPEIWDWMNA